jgi:hypothetical protein
MKRLWLALLVSVSCASSSFNYGENLTQPLPLPASTDGEWTAYRKQEANVSHFRWVTAGEVESLTVTTVKGKTMSARAYYDVDLKSGAKSCTAHETAIVDDSSIADYETITWSATCRREDPEPTMTWFLFRALSGRDSFYTVTKTWNREPTAEERNVWQAYLARISLCDTRRDETPCGEGWKPADTPERW